MTKTSENKLNADIDNVIEQLANLDWNTSTTNDIVNLTFDLRKSAKSIMLRKNRLKK